MKKLIVVCIAALYVIFYGLMFAIQWIVTLINEILVLAPPV